jgi:hypothetical protein
MGMAGNTASVPIRHEGGFWVRTNDGDGCEIVDGDGITWAWVRGKEIAQIVVGAMKARGVTVMTTLKRKSHLIGTLGKHRDISGGDTPQSGMQ